MSNNAMKIVLASVGVMALVFSCTNSSGGARLSVSQNSIIQQLSAVKGNGILFGHQDDLAYGVGWKAISGESDVKRVAGDYPSLFGWELGGLELGHSMNLDSVPFESIKLLSLKAYKDGGINTFSWHPYSPNKHFSAWAKDSIVVKNIISGGIYHQEFTQQLDILAEFFLSLKTENGHNMPFVFRPWHEMDGSWFWWGSKGCTPTEFKELFRFTVEYLRKKGLSQMVVAYSPDKQFDSPESYLTWYPGDDIVDILGQDNYYDFTQPNGAASVIQKLHIVISLAKGKNKLAAFTETGCENVSDSLWFTDKLGVVLSDSLINKEISYVMVWRNASTKHFFFPYPGHFSAGNAKKVLDRRDVLLLEEFNGLKNKK